MKPGTSFHRNKSEVAKTPKISVAFIGVGHDKASWTAALPSLGHYTIVREIRKKRRLASKSIEIEWDEDGQTARIWVGGERIVGWIKVLNAAKVDL